MRSEEAFQKAIDAKFPYDDADVAEGLIKEALAISPQAVFGVVEELARRPKHSRASDGTCLKLLHVIRSRFIHALCDDVCELAEKMIRREHIGSDESKNIMRKVAEFPGQYCALNIAYFSPSGDWDETIDDVRDEIVSEWKNHP